MSNQGTHFMNSTIRAMTEVFLIYHHKSTPYRPEENETMEAFNKILENVLQRSTMSIEMIVSWKYKPYYGNIGPHVRISKDRHHPNWCMGRR
jgi:hypothetical protein